MKLFLKATAAILAALAIASCAQRTDSTEPIPFVPGASTIHKEIQAGYLEGKTTLANFPVVHWQSSDVLAIWDGYARRAFTVKRWTNTGPRATFEGNVAEEASALTALYPASSFVSCEGDRVTAIIPPVQAIASGACNDAGATVALGKVGDGDEVSLLNATGLVKISIGSSHAGKINSVTLRGAAGEVLSGTAVFNSGTGRLEKVTEPCETVTIEAEDGGTLAAGSYAGKAFKGLFPAFQDSFRHGGIRFIGRSA
ncbi:MAG: hypothetical protein IJS66_01575 [Bacteroidales bacterium]|nr:hypothetical protein [Bacteroidales bacterium]